MGSAEASGSAGSAGDAPASVAAKPQHEREKKDVEGARHTNLDLAHSAAAELRKEREEGKRNDYYDQLGVVRGQRRPDPPPELPTKEEQVKKLEEQAKKEEQPKTEERPKKEE